METKVVCQLVGIDGNIFSVLGVASKALKSEGYSDEAEEMSNRVFDADNYDEALCIIFEYVTGSRLKTEQTRTRTRSHTHRIR